MNWGFVIKKLRQEQGMTQVELAQASGVGRPNLSRIELGHHKRASQELLEKFAKGLRMPIGDLSDAIYKKSLEPKAKDALDLLKKLQVELQSIPVYTEFPFHAGSPMEPMEYIYRSVNKNVKHHIEGYKVVGTCLSPIIEDGDLIIVDRERSIDNGDIVACIVDGELHLARVQKVAGELWLENNHGKLSFKDCQASAPVIEIVRRLK